jgi:hypothetical protein
MNNQSGLEIEIPWWALAIAGIVIVGLLGWFFSPRNAEDRPILLSPDVKAMEDYRRQANSWADDMRLLDGEISAVMLSDNSDLIGSMQKGQSALNHSIRLAQEIDQTGSPSAFAALRSELYDTSLAYVDAARAAARWLSIPNVDNQQAAIDAQKAARDEYNTLITSKWFL